MPTNEVKFEIARSAHTLWGNGPAEGSNSVKWRAALEYEALGQAKLRLLALEGMREPIYSLETYPDAKDPVVLRSRGFMAIRRILFFPDGEIWGDFKGSIHTDDPDEDVNEVFMRAAERSSGVNEQSYEDLLKLARAGMSQVIKGVVEAPSVVQ